MPAVPMPVPDPPPTPVAAAAAVTAGGVEPPPTGSPPPVTTTGSDSGGGSDTDVGEVRELLLRAYPDSVPDLIAGTTIPDLLASVEPARAAYARVAAAVHRQTAPAEPAIAIPAGGGTPLPIDPERLPAAEKIRRGLVALRRT